MSISRAKLRSPHPTAPADGQRLRLFKAGTACLLSCIAIAGVFAADVNCQEIQQNLIVRQQPTALTLESATGLAFENNPTLTKLVWQIESAKGNRFQQSRYPNPRVGIVSNEIGNGGSGGQYGVFVSRAIVLNGRLAENDRIFAWEVRKLEQQSNVLQRQIARKVATSFLEIGKRQQLIKLANLQLESLGGVQSISKKLFDGGEISALPGLTVKLAIETLRQQVDQLQLEIDVQKKVLAVLIGSDAESELVVQWPWDEMVEAAGQPHDSDVASLIIASNPEVAIAKSTVEQNRWRVRRAESDQCPDYQVQGSLNYGALTNDLFVGFQVGRPLQISDRKTGAIRAAMAELNRSAEHVELVRFRLRQKTTKELGTQAMLQKQILAYQTDLLDAAQNNFDKTEAAFAAGQVDFLQLKSGYEMLYQIRLQLVELQSQLLMSQMRLETLLSNDR